MTKESQQKVCSICGDPYEGWGHNAQPVNDGRCCGICNDTKVIPARIDEFFSRKAKVEELAERLGNVKWKH